MLQMYQKKDCRKKKLSFGIKNRIFCPAGGVSSGDLTDDHLDGLLVSISSSILFFCPCFPAQARNGLSAGLERCRAFVLQRSIL